MPLVEDEIYRKEHMARVRALGGWLSKGKERQRQEIQKPVKTANDRTLFWWRLRGCLWGLSTAFSIVGNMSGKLFPSHSPASNDFVSNFRPSISPHFQFSPTRTAIYCRCIIAMGSLGPNVCETAACSTTESTCESPREICVQSWYSTFILGQLAEWL